MKQMMFLTAAMVLACTHARLDLDTSSPAPTGIEMRLLSVHPDKFGTKAFLKLENQSDRNFVYYGYSLETPILTTEYFTPAGWIQQGLAVCGTGLELRRLKPGDSVKLEAYLGRRKSMHRIRIGISEADGGYTVWSPIIDLATNSWLETRAR